MATISFLSPTSPLRHHHPQHHLLPPSPLLLHLRRQRRRVPAISSLSRNLRTPPPPPPPGEVYQPFRPPPSPLPSKYRSLGPLERLEVLRDRLGLWHEYAPLISSLHNEGFTPPTIEEATGITGVEQNRFIVAAQVRDSLVSSSVEPAILDFFDSVGSAELLYELRLLNAAQRVAAAKFVIEFKLDPKDANELARAIKDFPRRRGDVGWDYFSGASPGDCLAFTRFRLSRELMSPAGRLAALEKALEAAETEAARKRVEEEIAKAEGGGGREEEEAAARSSVPVLRLRYGEVAEATSVVVLPVCDEKDGEEGLAGTPAWCKAEGEMGLVAAEKGWAKWAVLPGWTPVMGIGQRGGVAVAFADARAMPWRVNRWEKEEAVLVVAERGRRDVVEENGLYLVAVAAGGGGGGRLGVERGETLIERGVKEALGSVVLVVRPPTDDDDMINEEDWE